MDFFLNNYTFIIHFVEVLAAVAGLFCLKKYKGTIVAYFIYFLVYISIMELIGAYPTFVEKFESLAGVKELLKGTKLEKNYWWYTVFWSIVGTVFYAFYFSKFLESDNYKKALKLVTLIFIVSTMIYIVFNWNAFFVSTFYFISIFSALVILLAVVLYFVELLSNLRILSFYKSINFYIAAVLLVFFLINTPLVFYDVYFSRSDMD